QMVAKFQPQSVPKLLLADSKKTRPEADSRLDPEERVFALATESAAAAWPLRSFGEQPEMRSADLRGQRAAILWDGRTRTAAAFAPEIDGKPTESVNLAVDARESDAPWVDQETHSRWTIVGRAVSGPRKGETLKWLPGVMVKWYAWAAEYPKTSVLGN